VTILVLNAEQGLLRYDLYVMPEGRPLAQGRIERIGAKRAVLRHACPEKGKLTLRRKILDHGRALEVVLQTLTDRRKGPLRAVTEIEGVGHRIVYGGEAFDGSRLIRTEDLLRLMEMVQYTPLPLYENLKTVVAAQRLFPQIPQIAVFDTAYFSRLPLHTVLYALPYELYERGRLRRYGYHGPIHRDLARRGAHLLGESIEHLQIVTCYLNAEASVASTAKGAPAEVSTGFLPWEGLANATGCGTIDPSVFLQLLSEEWFGVNPAGMHGLLRERGGLRGIAGGNGMIEEILASSQHGNERAELALRYFIHRVRREVAAQVGMLGGADLLVFSGETGVQYPAIRERICSGLEFMGIAIDEAKNREQTRGEGVISNPLTPTQVCVLPVQPEWILAQETYEALTGREAQEASDRDRDPLL
jgi:acetate kinase